MSTDKPIFVFDANVHRNQRRRVLAALAAVGALPLAGKLAGYSPLGRAKAATAAAPNPDQQGLTGTWCDPSTSGQGILIETYPDFIEAGVGQLFGAWFTFATTSGGVDEQRWYTLDGRLDDDSETIEVTIYQNTGGSFAGGQDTFAVAVGSGTLTFSSCEAGVLDYAFDDGRSGSLQLTRLTANIACTSASETGSDDADFPLSGTWADPSTSGQGMVIEVNAASSTVFAGWFTYAVDADLLGESGQRWYTAQSSSYSSGSRTIELTLYTTTGGTFASAEPTTSVAVGTATLEFTECDSATFDYAFTSGEMAGRAGTLALSRVGATPTTCAFGSSCALIPEETDGPYPLYSALSNAAIVRSDITEDRTGVPLRLVLKVVDATGGCTPISNAAVYIWHCDKDGVYSGYSGQGTSNEIFLRGVQVTDANGKVTFDTIYPGWYSGRITHIHAQVYLNDALGNRAAVTTQFAFPDDITTAVYNSTLYAAHGQNTSVRSISQDDIFRDDDGVLEMLTITGSVADGFMATLTIGIAA